MGQVAAKKYFLAVVKSLTLFPFLFGVKHYDVAINLRGPRREVGDYRDRWEALDAARLCRGFSRKGGRTSSLIVTILARSPKAYRLEGGHGGLKYGPPKTRGLPERLGAEFDRTVGVCGGSPIGFPIWVYTLPAPSNKLYMPPGFHNFFRSTKADPRLWSNYGPVIVSSQCSRKPALWEPPRARGFFQSVTDRNWLLSRAEGSRVSRSRRPPPPFILKELWSDGS